MEVAYWLFWASLVLGIISGVLGFFVLRTVNRGFFKVMCYVGLSAAIVFWFFWFFGGTASTPSTPVPPAPI